MGELNNGTFRIQNSIVLVAILYSIGHAVHIDGAEFEHEGLHSPILYTLGSSTGLRGPILCLPGGVPGVPGVLGLLNVTNLYKLTIGVDSDLFSTSFGLGLTNNHILTS